MTIRENNVTLTNVPPFEVIDNGVVVFWATTKNECQTYINNL
jgi:hypothetical protein